MFSKIFESFNPCAFGLIANQSITHLYPNSFAGEIVAVAIFSPLLFFYNFTEELEAMKKICKGRPISIVNGKTKNLDAYEKESDSITFIQYQAGAMGLNLQKANKTIFFNRPKTKPRNTCKNRIIRNV